MSKPKKSSNVLYIALGLTVVVAAVLNMGGDPPKKTTTKAPITQSTGKLVSTGVKSDVLIQDEDSTKTFPVFKDKLKPSFKPLVLRSNVDVSTSGPSNQIPASFAGGESNWIYTGSATMDGRIQGLLENTSSGEGVFLSPGQHWKSLVCTAIREDGLVVTGPDGDTRTIALLTEPKDSDSVASVSPVNPAALSGNIDVLPDPTAAQGGGRRGRRNRGNAGGTANDPTAADGTGG